MTFNEMDIDESIKFFKNDYWFKPMTFFINYKLKDITAELIVGYLESEDIRYERLEDGDISQIIFNIGVDNKYDICRIIKVNDDLFYIDYTYSSVKSLSYRENRITVNPFSYYTIHDDWVTWLETRESEYVKIQENRVDKLNLLFNTDDDKYKISNNLIRHLREFNKESKNYFSVSVYEHYTRNGYISNKQLATIKDIMYYKRGFIY